MADHSNIDMATFPTTTCLHMLNNTCYSNWKSIIKFFFGVRFVGYFGSVREDANSYF